MGAKGRHGEDGAPAAPAEARVAVKKLVGFYRGLAEMLARHPGWTVVLLSGNALLREAIPFKPEVDHRLWNGPLEVRLLKYRVPRPPARRAHGP
jgi:putative N6-adenine-specific DNA methylase